ncbi:MAG: NAD-dependent epimerase/dehydratase family protein [Kiritimatiellaeota bacterium]|nr:NAD-dependent epimerase/dehydratase family protein [Kiritimatiellota bacterium]
MCGVRNKFAGRRVLVCGAGGFIGHQLVRYVKGAGGWVRGVDRKHPEFEATCADEFLAGDLRDTHIVNQALDQPFDEVYQLAADMGGAGYVFSGINDANIMSNSAQINLLMAERAREVGVGRFFFASSACIYPCSLQHETLDPRLPEASAYPAEPDSDYGWEKLFSERLYLAYARNHNLPVRIARFHNIFGPLSIWRGGREKFPTAICRKVAEAPPGGTLEVWGDGGQTRSFLYIDECLEGMCRLMASDCSEPVNIGSEEMLSVDALARMTMEIAGKTLQVRHVPGPQGVRGRRSDNTLIREKLGWAPTRPLREGMEKTYAWIDQQVQDMKRKA